ncbi:hypothetical protein, partial [Pseudomonas aeruginosa]|uniref:hypothetical protein n=1 Tax=Pseudomonas aeruginosa TaxID=287 RepID=UPI004043ED69
FGYRAWKAAKNCSKLNSAARVSTVMRTFSAFFVITLMLSLGGVAHSFAKLDISNHHSLLASASLVAAPNKA